MDKSRDWQISKHQVIQRGQYLLESGELSDCKFIVGQEPQQQIIVGHKLFLAMSSPVFNAMLYGNMEEKNDLISIPDVQPEIFKTFLKYIYTNKVELDSLESVCELCYCAKKYMLPYLVTECIKYLCTNVSPNKACKTYEFAQLLEEPALMEKCLNIIRTNTTEVLDEPNWEEVKLDTLLTIFEQHSLNINTEMKLFTAAERWAKAECISKSLNPSDTKCLRLAINDALSKIRFLTLTPRQFAEGIYKTFLLTTDEAFAIFMKISSSTSIIPIPENFSINSVHRENALTVPQNQLCQYCRRNCCCNKN